MEKLKRFNVVLDIQKQKYSFKKTLNGKYCNSEEVAELEEAYQKLEAENAILKRALGLSCEHNYVSDRDTLSFIQQAERELKDETEE